MCHRTSWTNVNPVSGTPSFVKPPIPSSGNTLFVKAKAHKRTSPNQKTGME